MAKASDLVALIACWADGDDERFRLRCDAIAANEDAKGHHNTALRIREHTERRGAARRTLHPLPTARKSGQTTLTTQAPRRTLDTVSLPGDVRETISLIANCWRQRHALRRAGTDHKGAALLIGPSGCGKTVTAEALAGELDLPFVRLNLLTIMSSYLGETATQLAEVFAYIDATPCVAVIDEFDALGSARDDDREVGEIRRVVAGLLQLLDEGRRDSIVVGTCNHPGMIDFAFWRRFDEVLHIPLPTPEAREEILRRLLNVPAETPLTPLVAATAGFSGASVENIAHDAIRHRTLSGSPSLTTTHLNTALSDEQRRRALHASVDPDFYAVTSATSGDAEQPARWWPAERAS